MNQKNEESIEKDKQLFFITIMNILMHCGFTVGWYKWKFRNLSHNEGRQVTGWIVLSSGKLLSQELSFSKLLPRKAKLLEPMQGTVCSITEGMEELNDYFNNKKI